MNSNTECYIILKRPWENGLPQLIRGQANKNLQLIQNT